MLVGSISSEREREKGENDKRRKRMNGLEDDVNLATVCV